MSLLRGEVRVSVTFLFLLLVFGYVLAVTFTYLVYMSIFKCIYLYCLAFALYLLENNLTKIVKGSSLGYLVIYMTNTRILKFVMNL